MAQITDGPARLVVRLNEGGNGVSLPDRARGVSLLSRLLDFKLLDATFEADLTEFMSLKNKHEKATGKSLDDDLLVTLIVNKTSGSLQQYLRLNVDAFTTFSEVLAIVKQYYQSRLLAKWRSSIDTGGPTPMDVGALMKGKGRYWHSKGKGKNGKGSSTGKGKGKKRDWNRNWKGKGKGKSKGKGYDGTGCFMCGSQSHWSKNCPQARQTSIAEETLAAAASSSDYPAEDWSWDWNESCNGQEE